MPDSEDEIQSVERQLTQAILIGVVDGQERSEILKEMIADGVFESDVEADEFYSKSVTTLADGEALQRMTQAPDDDEMAANYAKAFEDQLQSFHNEIVTYLATGRSVEEVVELMADIYDIPSEVLHELVRAAAPAQRRKPWWRFW